MVATPDTASGSARPKDREPDDREPRLSRGQIVAICGLVVVVLVVGVVTFLELRPNPDTRLNASLAHRIRCTGTNVQHAVMVPNEAPATIALVSSSMRCPIDVVIRNIGPSSAIVQTITFPGLGPGASSAVRVTGPGAVAGGNDMDATFTVNRSLLVGKKVALTFWLVARPSGCTASGTVDSRQQVPELAYSVDGHSRSSHGHAIIAWRGTAESACPAGR